jgi:hypothetical protein
MKSHLKTVLLTTDTTHHQFFSQKINELFPWDAIFLETQSVPASFDTYHIFEKKRDEYEREFLLAGSNQSFPDGVEIYKYDSLNGENAISTLSEISPDVIIIFGTGKLSRSVTNTAKITCLNLHGGNPEQYRGLDSHLWAIYHQDFINLVTTLHNANDSLDTGDIIFQSRLPLSKNSKIFQLRSINTKVCVNLSALALLSLNNSLELPCRKQIGQGRYYSFMPAVIKENCVKKFENHMITL